MFCCYMGLWKRVKEMVLGAVLYLLPSSSRLDLEPVPGSQVRLFCTGLETHVNGCSFSSPDVTDHSTDAYIYCMCTCVIIHFVYSGTSL